MKNLFLLFLFFPLLTFGQARSKPFENSNLIIIKTNDTPGDALKKFAYLLQDKGYFIQDFDSELKNVTAFKVIDNTTFYVQAYLREDQETLINASAFTSYIGEDGQYLIQAIQDNGLTRGARRKNFNRLEELTKSYPGGLISYGRIKPD